MQQIKSYDNYKDSGIEWIGEIPSHWQIDKFSRIFNRITDYVASGSFADIDANVQYLDEPDYAMLVRTADLSGTKDKRVYINEHAYNYLSNSNLFGGELILSNIGSVGNVYIYKPIYKYSSLAPNAILLDGSENNKFMYYWLISPLVNDELKKIGGNAVQLKFNKTQLRQFKAVYPSKLEQQQIADFLDKKCGDIDRVVETQKNIIEKLKEYKQSVTTEAITKGLDKSVPLKDSGIKWIGKIPQHWSINRGKNVLTLLKREVEDNMEVITCFRDGQVTLRKNRREDGFTFADKECGYQGIFVGDLVIHGMDGFAGAIGISDSNGKGSPVLNVCNPKNNYSVEYICYYLRMLASQNIFLALATGIRERSCDLRWQKIANLLFILPTVDEQKQIAKFIDKKCSKIDSVISDKEQLIEKLTEYKKSLIYECVTGKRKVVIKCQF